MENLKVVVSGDQKEIIFREGVALTPQAPVVVNLVGDIDSVKNYANKRVRFTSVSSVKDGTEQVSQVTERNALQMIDESLAIIEMDRTNLKIKLSLNPTDYYAPTVTGKLEMSDELKPWKINTSTLLSREELISLLKFNKRFFTNGEKHSELLRAYQTLNLTGSTSIKMESDTRGNKDNQFKKTINSEGIPVFFFLEIPIFKGRPPVKFQVEICLESSENKVIFWLESVELKEIWDKTVDAIFNEQRDIFSSFVIINK